MVISFLNLRAAAVKIILKKRPDNGEGVQQIKICEKIWQSATPPFPKDCALQGYFGTFFH